MSYTIDLGNPPRYGSDAGNQINYHLTKLGDNLFVLEECQNFAEGLSNRGHLYEQEGMLFDFNDDSPKIFHMKNCLISLDILFIKNNIIEKIYHKCSPCKGNECKKYIHNSADTVVELFGGTCKKYNISEGLEFRVL